MEMSKVVADLEYVLADNCGLGDDADVNADDSIASSCNAAVKVCLIMQYLWYSCDTCEILFCHDYIDFNFQKEQKEISQSFER